MQWTEKYLVLGYRPTAELYLKKKTAFFYVMQGFLNKKKQLFNKKVERENSCECLYFYLNMYFVTLYMVMES